MSSSVESYLTRELDLRFIDARRISSEAKLSLGIHGYPTQEQIEFIKEEALRIFNSMSECERDTLQKLHMDFEATKTPASSEISNSSSHGSRNRRSSLVSLFRSRDA